VDADGDTGLTVMNVHGHVDIETNMDMDTGEGFTSPSGRVLVGSSAVFIASMSMRIIVQVQFSIAFFQEREEPESREKPRPLKKRKTENRNRIKITRWIDRQQMTETITSG